MSKISKEEIKMRIRYAYKLEDNEGNTSFAVLNHKLSEEEVLNKFADKGIATVTFHDRVRTGFRLDGDGNLVPTGLVNTAEAPAPTPAAPKAPKAKKSKKSK